MFNCDLFQEGTTPLVLAAANNHVECVRELLKQGADAAARRLVSTLYSQHCWFIHTQWNRDRDLDQSSGLTSGPGLRLGFVGCNVKCS